MQLSASCTLCTSGGSGVLVGVEVGVRVGCAVKVGCSVGVLVTVGVGSTNGLMPCANKISSSPIVISSSSAPTISGMGSAGPLPSAPRASPKPPVGSPLRFYSKPGFGGSAAAQPRSVWLRLLRPRRITDICARARARLA
ncbi:hypothetical protein EMGBS3_15600 [Anaerolineaceae bacterium]|nr:hypothetical protein EMGBS3_15600 [Anaerolineaceae bacterium]